MGNMCERILCTGKRAQCSITYVVIVKNHVAFDEEDYCCSICGIESDPKCLELVCMRVCVCMCLKEICT